MAPVAGVPFLTHIIRYWLSQGVERFIFSLGYKHEVIEDFLKQSFPTIQCKVVIEDTPLMTGGAIAKALREAQTQDVLIVNGDTLFKVDLGELERFHALHHAVCTLALKPMRSFDRYGVVRTDAEGRIEAFEEKRQYDAGNINGGVYLLNKAAFQKHNWPETFSFEKEYLESNAKAGQLYAIVQNGYFIDIGIPADYEKAQLDLSKKRLPFELIDQSWTLFLDRDGVINVNKAESYIFTPEEFIFNAGAKEAMASLRSIVGRMIIVTNQRGIGRGLMTEEDLHRVHDYMLSELRQSGVQIDGIYYCAINDNLHFDRKPNPGLALKAKADFPDIDFAKAIMIGDKLIDMEWGRNIGTYTILIDPASTPSTSEHPDIDWVCPSLASLEAFIPDPD
jgi:D-glycero-alpha-D-manno-heptose 1-phosphate guanylyltransferase